VDGPLGEVDAGGDLGVDDVAIALRMIVGDADVLVEHERLRVREGQSFVLVAGGQLIVDAQRARTGRQPDDRCGFGAQQPLDRIGGELRQRVFVGDDDFHQFSFGVMRCRFDISRPVLSVLRLMFGVLRSSFDTGQVGCVGVSLQSIISVQGRA
jgi:hypothetical protein